MNNVQLPANPRQIERVNVHKRASIQTKGTSNVYQNVYSLSSKEETQRKRYNISKKNGKAKRKDRKKKKEIEKRNFNSRFKFSLSIVYMCLLLLY